MHFGIHTMDDFNYAGKTVLCRVDLNQPVDPASGTLRSIARIEASVPTICELSEKGARVVLLAHQGSDIEYENFYSTRPHADVLSRLLGTEVYWIDDVCGPAARAAIKGLRDGEILLLDNVRYLGEEQTWFERKLALTPAQQAKTLLVEKLTPLADYYVCDAFAAAHRSQPSLCGFPLVLPSAMGRLFEREYSILASLMSTPKRPAVYVLGGSKIADAFQMMDTVLRRGAADQILTGGLVGNIFLAAKGEEIGRGSLDFIAKCNYSGFVDEAKKLYCQFSDRIMLPVDLSYIYQGVRRTCALGAVPEEICAVDIGEETARHYQACIEQAGVVFANGPMGIFEKEASELGTRVVLQAMANAKAFTVIGGGDTIAAAAQFGVKAQMDYVCTGGGALIRFLSGEELPAVAALRTSASLWGGTSA